MQEALNDIADTGEARYRRYHVQVDRFPRFQYAEQSVGEWSAVLAGLLIPADLLGMFAAYRARSYAIDS